MQALSTVSRAFKAVVRPKRSVAAAAREAKAAAAMPKEQVEQDITSAGERMQINLDEVAANTWNDMVSMSYYEKLNRYHAEQKEFEVVERGMLSWGQALGGRTVLMGGVEVAAGDTIDFVLDQLRPRPPTASGSAGAGGGFAGVMVYGTPLLQAVQRIMVEALDLAAALPAICGLVSAAHIRGRQVALTLGPLRVISVASYVKQGRHIMSVMQRQSAMTAVDAAEVESLQQGVDAALPILHESALATVHTVAAITQAAKRTGSILRLHDAFVGAVVAVSRAATDDAAAAEALVQYSTELELGLLSVAESSLPLGASWMRQRNVLVYGGFRDMGVLAQQMVTQFAAVIGSRRLQLGTAERLELSSSKGEVPVVVVANRKDHLEHLDTLEGMCRVYAAPSDLSPFTDVGTGALGGTHVLCEAYHHSGRLERVLEQQRKDLLIAHNTLRNELVPPVGMLKDMRHMLSMVLRVLGTEGLSEKELAALAEIREGMAADAAAGGAAPESNLALLLEGAPTPNALHTLVVSGHGQHTLTDDGAAQLTAAMAAWCPL